MDLDQIRKEREKWLSWKDNKRREELLEKLPFIQNLYLKLEDTITLDSSNILANEKKIIFDIAQELKPWRKGPFKVFDTFIDTEWKSFIKYNLLKPHFNLKDKVVADIGCNNGYYLFRMLEQNPKKIVGFDPSVLYKQQFDFINHFAKTKISYELLGVEHLPFYEHKFDTLFCLGVLYHRPNPVGTLKDLLQGLEKGGELILDTFMIDGDEPVALSPGKTYSKIPNIYFVPTIHALQNWFEKAKFSSFEILEIKKTNLEEQRKTAWIEGESLNNFLDPHDSNLTIEGYPAPKRVYVKAKR
jgi:tRNA (mo5U34)-methyltransferase